MSLIVMEWNYYAIDADDYSYHGYYIIKFSSSTYILQADLSIDGQVISSCKWYVKEIIFSQSISFLMIMFYKKVNAITQFLI